MYNKGLHDGLVGAGGPGPVLVRVFGQDSAAFPHLGPGCL